MVKTSATPHLVSRGFYQVEEDLLYVPVYPAGKFYSYLDSPQAVLDVDREGRLLFIQVNVPRRQWEASEASMPPGDSEYADIRFLDFREPLPELRLEADPDRSWLRLVFEDCTRTTTYLLADNLKVELNDDRFLVSIWILAIDEDRAARGMAAWRKQSRKNHKRKGDHSPYVRVEVTPLTDKNKISPSSGT